MEDASHHFVYLVELQEKAGAKIAQLLGVEAAMVTSGPRALSSWAPLHAWPERFRKKKAHQPMPTSRIEKN